MSHMSKIAVLVGALCITPAAHAGWVAEWEHTLIKTNGDRGTAEPATMRIEKGKVRLVQPNTTSLIDYNNSRFTILNTDRQYFWSGTVDQYVSEMLKVRARSAKRRTGEDVAPETDPKVDTKSLPPVAITRTEQVETVAGHPTHKYEIRVKDELFEELWVAEGLDLSGDMDTNKFLAYQKKMGAAMVGNSATAYNAIYHSPEYKNLLEKGFILRSITHHIAGGFERKAIELKQVEIPDNEFEVPDNYRKVRLSDIFATGETS
jgi:hypothetical protein